MTEPDNPGLVVGDDGLARPSSPTTRSGLSGSVTSTSSSVTCQGRLVGVVSRSARPNGSRDSGRAACRQWAGWQAAVPRPSR